MYSSEHKLFLKNIQKNKIVTAFLQILILLIFLISWEILSYYEILNPFLYSSPSKIINTIIGLFKTNNLFSHIYITLYETIISFFASSFIGLCLASIFWWWNVVFKIFDPYLTVLNSLPKVALGPLIIIWVGASTNSIIFMALLISTFISIINIYNSFISTDKDLITLMKSINAKKYQIFLKIIIPSNIKNILNAFKINISMSLIGVIMGELLVSKKGLGYLIMYGSQVFNVNLIITATFILGIISYIMYFLINKLDIFIEKKQN